MSGCDIPWPNKSVIARSWSARFSVGHFAGLLAAERRAAPLVWHRNVSLSFVVVVVVVVLVNSEELH